MNTSEKDQNHYIYACTMYFYKLYQQNHRFVLFELYKTITLRHHII